MGVVLRRVLSGGGAGAAICLVVTAATSTPSSAAPPPSPAWTGFANNAQHTAVSSVSPQPLTAVHWHVKVDHDPGNVVPDGPIAHYASPMITGSNTVVVPTRFNAKRGFDLIAYAGADGSKLWQFHTDYAVPPQSAKWWPPPIPATLRDNNHAVVAGAGGTLLVRRHVNSADGGVRRIAFYGLDQWRAHRAAYRKDVFVTTPITTGPDGSLYFGFSAAPGTPGGLHDGVAVVRPDGKADWVSARRLAGNHRPAHVPLNCAPALSNDGTTAYVAVVSRHRQHNELVGFDTATLAPEFRHVLRDPQTHKPAGMYESSSATPTVGPDGDVYYGILGNPLLKHDFRGWLLHFNADLSKLRTPGSFGWDQSVSVVPATSVPSYTGHSSYLLVSKYNNYDAGPHGDGRNELALLDPHAHEKDEYSKVQVMSEVSTVLSPHHAPHSPPGSRYEWCVNSVAVDPATGSAIANNEDGHLYRWDLNTGQLVESIQLGPAVGQAYTMTVIGPDGTSYAIENAVLYAVGG